MKYGKFPQMVPHLRKNPVAAPVFVNPTPIPNASVPTHTATSFICAVTTETHRHSASASRYQLMCGVQKSNAAPASANGPLTGASPVDGAAPGARASFSAGALSYTTHARAWNVRNGTMSCSKTRRRRSATRSSPSRLDATSDREHLPETTQNMGMAMALDHVYSARSPGTIADDVTTPSSRPESSRTSAPHHARPVLRSSVVSSHCSECPRPMRIISANLQLSRYASLVLADPLSPVERTVSFGSTSVSTSDGTMTVTPLSGGSGVEEVGGGVRDVKMRWDVPAGLSSKGLFSPSASPILRTTPLYMRDNGDASSASPRPSFGNESFGKK